MNASLRHFVVLFALLVLSFGCGGAHPVQRPAVELRAFTEGQALTFIDEVTRESGLALGPPFEVDIGAPRPLEVDARIGSTRYTIEWVSPQDRADYGEAIPTPPADGSLLILPGQGEDESIEILLLDSQRYRFDPRPDAVYQGAASAAEAEARIRRDVRDFLEYCRGQL